MTELLSLEVAVFLMLAGAVPSVINIYFVWDDRYELGVSWFILSMATGGLWAVLYTAFTVVPSASATLFLANFFWPLVPTAALTMFLLAYEFVFKQPISRSVALVLFSPIALLFVLSWTNPSDLVFTTAYYVGDDGFLYFPRFDGPVKIAVTQVYGYLLVFMAAGMFVGEAMRTSGSRRKRVVYLIAIFSILIASTMVKVAGVVPVFFDPTSVVYSASGLMFAYSIHKYGLFKSISIGREQTFEEVNDAILVVDAGDVVVDHNQRATDLFRKNMVGDHLETIIHQFDERELDAEMTASQLVGDDTERYFHCKTSPVEYGRNCEGRIIIISDITTLKQQEQELHLLVQIFSRVYRHNMRNDFNVIQGYLDRIQQHTNGEVSALSDRIDTKITGILQQATKARNIEQIFSDSETVSYSITAVVDDVRSSFANRDDVVFTVAVDDVSVEVNSRFDLALRELVDNAVRHHPSAETVEIKIRTETTTDDVVLVVSDNGCGISEYELSVLQAAEETDLQHSSGIGLWLVRAVVTRSNGELAVESAESGTDIRIRLPRAKSNELPA